jgi:O-antigen/teichoic acid export membrane protein
VIATCHAIMRLPHRMRIVSLQIERTLSRAAAQQWLGAMACGAISVALMAWLARGLGPAQFALYGATLNVALVALVLMEGGWSSLMYRELSRTPRILGSHRLPSAAFAYSLSSFLPCWLVALFFTSSASVALAATICMFTIAQMNQRSARLRAAGEFYNEALWQLAGRASSALAIVATLSWSVSSSETGEIGTIAVFFAWAAGLSFCLMLTLPRWWSAPSWAAVRSLYPMAASVLVVELGIAVLAKGDLVVLFAAREWSGLVAGNGLGPAYAPPPPIVSDALAGYAASVRLMEAVLLGIAPLGNVVIAFMRSKTASRSASTYRTVFVASFCFWLMGCMVWGLGWLFNERIFAVVFGEAFVSGASWLKWANLPLPWMMANLLLLQAALAVVSLKRIACIAIAVASGFVVCSVLMSHFFNVAGVAAAAALWQAVLTLLLIRALRRQSNLTGAATV